LYYTNVNFSFWVSIVRSSHIREFIFKRVCDYFSECGFTNHDVIFAMPISPLVTQDVHNQVKSTMSYVVQHSDMTSGNTRVGLFVFDTEARMSMTVPLNAVLCPTPLSGLISMSSYMPSDEAPLLTVALKQILTMFTSPENRESAADIAFLVLDKSFNMLGSMELAADLRRRGIRLDIVAVGYQDPRIPSLFAYSAENVYLVDNYTTLPHLLPDMFQRDFCSKCPCESKS